MDRRRIELQLRAILLTYRVEHRRRDSSMIREFRERARSLLDGLEQYVRAHPDLQDALDDARRELFGERLPPRSPGGPSADQSGSHGAGGGN